MLFSQRGVAGGMQSSKLWKLGGHHWNLEFGAGYL